MGWGSGLLEWVQNTVGFRAIVKALHEQIGIPNDFVKARAVLEAANQDLARIEAPEQRNLRELKLYRDWCDLYPVVAPKWLLTTFAEPSAWFAARSLFTRSCAVWSMVGCPLCAAHVMIAIM